MKKLLFVFGCVLMAFAAGAQVGKPTINNAVGPSTSAQYLSTVTDAAGDGQMVFNNGPSLKLKQMSETAPTATINQSTGDLPIDITTGSVFSVTLNHDITGITLTGTASGRANAFTLIFIPDGTQRNIVFGSGFWLPNGAPLTLASLSGTRDMVGCLKDATGLWLCLGGNYNFLPSGS